MFYGFSSWNPPNFFGVRTYAEWLFSNRYERILVLSRTFYQLHWTKFYFSQFQVQFGDLSYTNEDTSLPYKVNEFHEFPVWLSSNGISDIFGFFIWLKMIFPWTFYPTCKSSSSLLQIRWKRGKWLFFIKESK